VAAALSEAGTQYPTLASDAATATPTDGSPQKSASAGSLLAAPAALASPAPARAAASAQRTGEAEEQQQQQLSGLLAEMPTGVTGLYGGQAVLPLSSVSSSLLLSSRFLSTPIPTAAPLPLAARQEAEFTFSPGDGAAPLTFTFGSIDAAVPPATLAVPQADDGGRSGNDDAPPLDVNNLEAPDIGWVATLIGGVPYKNGDLAAYVLVAAPLFPPPPLSSLHPSPLASKADPPSVAEQLHRVDPRHAASGAPLPRAPPAALLAHLRRALHHRALHDCYARHVWDTRLHFQQRAHDDADDSASWPFVDAPRQQGRT
jgi:hypothetical protein